MDANTNKYNRNTRLSLYAGYAAVCVVSILILGKAYAYYASGSASVLSSLIDSIVDSFISVTTLASIYYANRPPDEDHRWGHGKMEAVSALFQSAVIVGGGAFLVFESVNRFFDPSPVFRHEVGIYVMAFSIVLSFFLVTIQRYVLTHTESLAVEADSAHYGSDIVVNIGVFLVLLFQMYGAPLWIDPLFALGVAVFMAFIAKDIGSKAINMLMDRELPDEERQKIIRVIESHKGVLGWHDLRSHRHGSFYAVSFDIEADPSLTLWAAHEITKELETGILQIYPNAEILIHVDPSGYTEDARHRVKGVHH